MLTFLSRVVPTLAEEKVRPLVKLDGSSLHIGG